MTNDYSMYHKTKERPTVCSYCLVPLRKTLWHGEGIFRCPECGLELKEPPPYFNEKEAALERKQRSNRTASTIASIKRRPSAVANLCRIPGCSHGGRLN